MLHRNLEWKLTALVLAIGVWAYVTVNARAGEKTFRVPIEIGSLPKHLALITPPGQATLILKGDKSDLDASGDQVRANALLEILQPGSVRAKVKAQFPSELELVEIRPQQISLKFERVVRRTLPITARLKGELSPGFTVGDPEISPSQGRIYGAQSAVARVARLMVGVDIASGLLGLPQSGLVYPVEASGRQAEGVSLEPQTAVVTLPVTSNIASKILPVFPALEGEPAEGWLVKRVTVEPALVTAAGDAAVIRNLPGINTVSLSLKNISSSISRKVNLIIPQGIASISERAVLVKVNLAPAPNSPDSSTKPEPKAEDFPGPRPQEP
jgi:YbbR domain-containing protein